MGFADIVKLVIYSAGMATGQLLFTAAARRLSPADGVFSVLLDPLFILALALYFGLTFAWVWILTTVPLSRAFPLSFLSIVMVSLGSRLVFGEALNPAYLAGVACAIFGLVLIAAS